MFLVVPSVSLMYGSPWSNPGIRKFLYNQDTLTIEDFTQYYLDLTDSNSQDTPVWKELYSFSDYGYNEV